MMMTEVFCGARETKSLARSQLSHKYLKKPDYQKGLSLKSLNVEEKKRQFWIFRVSRRIRKVSQPCKAAINSLRYFHTHGTDQLFSLAGVERGNYSNIELN